MSRKEWKDGNRAFYWSTEFKRSLCLQSKEYNKDRKGVTWVYYSKRDAKRLLDFLSGILIPTK